MKLDKKISDTTFIVSRNREITKELSKNISPNVEIFEEAKSEPLFKRNSIIHRPITAKQLKLQSKTQKRNKSAPPEREVIKSKKHHGKIQYNPICEIDPNATPEGRWLLI